MSDRDQVGPMEKRLIALERRQQRVGADLQSRNKEATALWQNIWASWDELTANPAIGTPTPTPTPTSTAFNGTIFGCAGGGISGATVVITDGIGATLATVTSSGGGAYSGTVSIAIPTSTTVTISPVSTRQAVGTTSGTLMPGISHNYGGFILAPAAGFACINLCDIPFATTLSLAAGAACGISTWPSDTLTYGTTPAYAATLVGASSGWLGTSLTLPGLGANAFYFLSPLNGKLWEIKNGTPAQARAISGAVPDVTDCTTHTLTYICSVGLGGSASINATIN